MITSLLEKLIKRLSKKKDLNEIQKIILTVDASYPNDVGCFCVFLLNYCVLKPGEAMFLKANEPHAYLSGGKDELNH